MTDFLADHVPTVVVAFFVALGVAVLLAAYVTAHDALSKRAVRLGLTVSTALVVADCVMIHMAGNASHARLDVLRASVAEKAAAQYGDVFTDGQFDQRFRRLAEAKVWQIDGEPLVCAADVTGDPGDPASAEVTVLCGGTELPRVDDTEKS